MDSVCMCTAVNWLLQFLSRIFHTHKMHLFLVRFKHVQLVAVLHPSIRIVCWLILFLFQSAYVFVCVFVRIHELCCHCNPFSMNIRTNSTTKVAQDMKERDSWAITVHHPNCATAPATSMPRRDLCNALAVYAWLRVGVGVRLVCVNMSKI